MMGCSKMLNVAYFVQPTGITCQSTCLKMFATYLEQTAVLKSTDAAAEDIQAIRKHINEDPKCPITVRNAHRNMQWWLEQHFSSPAGGSWSPFRKTLDCRSAHSAAGSDSRRPPRPNVCGGWRTRESSRGIAWSSPWSGWASR